ncbi:beta-galactosidase [Anoxybacillus kestanbolensis]|uniref:beta-galactosidase n=1 Tax=Anoxybacillus kestanbolensis TaxID=227476 RepID=UPI003D22681E
MSKSTSVFAFLAWLAKKHPDILSKDEFGRVRVFGGRRQYCFNSTTYGRGVFSHKARRLILQRSFFDCMSCFIV